MVVIGWVDAYTKAYPASTFTKDKRQALVERMRKRRYNFNFFDFEMMSYCCPFFSDRTTCVLTKAQFDSIMDEVYADIPRGARLLPMDAIEDRPVNGVLFEKKKFMEEYSNGKN